MRSIFLAILIFAAAYCCAAEADKSLIIVTTEALKNNSAKLSEFIAEKEKRGFSVLVGTEKDFGSDTLKGYEKAKKIRQWLKKVHAGYSFLLLIGDPNTKMGDVPMVTAMPSGPDAPDPCISSGSECTKIATDYYYADLSGEYDLDNDGVVGQSPNDFAEGGIDFGAELYTGRIPVYFGDYEELDKTLSHAIGYMQMKEPETAYRKKMLFPMSFIWFDGYKVFQTMHENKETAETSEWFIQNILKNYPGVSYTRLYEAEGFYPSRYQYERPLNRNNVIDEWKKGYGMVFWGGHGRESMVVRTVWLEDTNNNNLGENDEVDSYSIVEASDAKLVATGQPGFIVAISCLVGHVDAPGSVTSKYLDEGAAVGIISSTNVTDPSKTNWPDFTAGLDESTLSEDTAGVIFFEGLLKGKYAGQIFYDYKKAYGQNPAGRAIDHKFMLNYYGDPSLTLYDTAVEETADADSNEGGLINDADNQVTESNNSGGCSIILL